MGLYGERVGSLCVVCPSAEKAKAVESRLGKIIRPMYSNPPKHGALIASMILNAPELRQQWLGELAGMSNRILDMRKALFDELMKLKTPGVWTHITSQIGMFSYTGLTAEQVRYMTEKHHVYLLNSGRISMAGLNSSNVARLAAAMHDAITNGPSKKLKTNL
jgi:aspartate/tyrosine/aromatic aminotransferase